MKSLRDQFVDWLETKPADERYHYWDSDRCPITQFGQGAGYIDPDQSFGFSDALCGLHNNGYEALKAHPWTFGALRQRLMAQS